MDWEAARGRGKRGVAGGMLDFKNERMGKGLFLLPCVGGG